MHITPANLSELFHRSIEAETTERVMRVIFADGTVVVHAPSGALRRRRSANHTRLAVLSCRGARFRLGRSISGETP